MLLSLHNLAHTVIQWHVICQNCILKPHWHVAVKQTDLCCEALHRFFHFSTRSMSFCWTSKPDFCVHSCLNKSDYSHLKKSCCSHYYIRVYVKFRFYVSTARRYASTVYAIVMYLCVCLSHANIVSIVPKRLNIGSCNQCHMIGRGL